MRMGLLIFRLLVTGNYLDRLGRGSGVSRHQSDCENILTGGANQDIPPRLPDLIWNRLGHANGAPSSPARTYRPSPARGLVGGALGRNAARRNQAGAGVGCRPQHGAGQENVPSRDFFGYAIASFIVSRVNEERAATLILFDGDKVRLAGTVSIPLDHAIPSPGSVVVCGYINAFKQSGCIRNAKYLGKSESIRAAECTTRQLNCSTELEPQLN